jgi:peptidoglycan/LPS O-acetylase OafA/YrhL
MASSSGRVATVDVLRGLASFSVAWFHFTNGNPGFLSPGLLKSTGAYGWLGVSMFFVISGFVIPYALNKAQYGVNQYGRFLAKRIIRLDPPYIADICLILALAYLVPLAPMFQGGPPTYTITQLLGHLGYLNSLIGKPWVNPVFWSLGIEFQYYLLVGLIFPLLVATNRVLRLALLATLLVPGLFIPQPSLIFVALPLFVAGILTFQRKIGLLSIHLFAAGLAVAFSVTWFESGLGTAVVMLVTALAITFLNLRSRLLTWLGTISYSLYLVHVPIGGRVVNLSARYARGLYTEITVLILAVSASILAAYLLYWAVELPSQRLSSRISYRRTSARISLRAPLNAKELSA